MCLLWAAGLAHDVVLREEYPHLRKLDGVPELLQLRDDLHRTELLLESPPDDLGLEAQKKSAGLCGVVPGALLAKTQLEAALLNLPSFTVEFNSNLLVSKAFNCVQSDDAISMINE